MPSPWIAVAAVLIVVAVSLWLRRATVEQGGGPAAGSVDPPELLDPDADSETPDEEGDPGERVPVTAEGIALVRTGSQVALIALIQSEEMPEWVRGGIEDSSVPYQFVNQIYGLAAHGSHGAKPGMILNAGDFTAARIRRDAGAGLWCLETLGRDGDFGFFPFETDEGARIALAMLQSLGIVRVELDEDLQPIPPSQEDFEEARRRYDETERSLALENDPGEGLSPGTHSDRR